MKLSGSIVSNADLTTTKVAPNKKDAASRAATARFSLTANTDQESKTSRYPAPNARRPS